MRQNAIIGRMGIPNAEFRTRKRQALELLEWTLADMSPEGRPEAQLRLKCGFEREGHFVPEALPEPTEPIDHWKHNRHWPVMKRYAEQMQDHLRDYPGLERVYHDTGGTFMLEAVTRPLGLVQATDAIDRISRGMLEKAKAMPFRETGFGSVPADAADDLNAAAKRAGLKEGFAERAFTDYDGEVFPVEGRKTLVGRGQHCNLSLWVGKTNLFEREGQRMFSNWKYDLVHHAAARALEWLPHMFMPCRNGNYHRIQRVSKVGIRDFSAGEMTAIKSNHVMRYTAKGFPGGRETDTYRLEFRQGSSEADPYDMALASAAPLVKTCDEVLEKDANGKITLDRAHRPKLLREREFPKDYHQPVPKTEEDAKALFNAPENPYFDYLDRLAQRKFDKVKARYDRQPGHVNEEALRDAESLLGIGTQLYAGYCDTYQMPNLMPPASKAGMAI